ncbi:hypothetical protein Tco_0978465 [Tanacetum coccineum]|uniref:Retrotransposon gag domain-containing protein n=1 Tax=Tanacetum coccineum TaxID=301880 RepID=A0ABQ5EMZ9_9ASTR
MNDDTPMCERHEANYIQSEGYQNRDSHNSFSRQSHHDPNESEKSLRELNNDVKNDLEDFKRCIRSMRTVHDKLLTETMFEDPNQHLKEFLKIADSIDLNGASKEIKCMRLYKFSIHDQAINWLEHLPMGSISNWEDHFSFPRSVFPPGRTTKLRNDMLMFQQNHSESLYEAWTPTRRVIDHSPDGKLHDKSAKKSWEIIEGLALYEKESWIDLRDLVKSVKAVSLPLDDSLSLKIKSNA